jgi:CRISPR-associated protein Csm1
MAHVPAEGGVPTTFVDLARRSRGDALLGVLKADADSLGAAVEAALSRGADLGPLAEFSAALDGFFATRLQVEIEAGRDPRWQLIYTIFGGGDDLAMVGPWDVMIDFAERLNELFRAEFAGRGLTLSAGLALTKPKRPIKSAVAEADRLLEVAKTTTAAGESGPKDQLAVLGQVWKWRHHRGVVAAAHQLVGWCTAGQIERGWLHTLLELVEARHGLSPDPRATARLAHHVARNYRPRTAARAWADQLVQTFDDATRPDVRYLSAALRYALTATRKPGEEE